MKKEQGMPLFAVGRKSPLRAQLQSLDLLMKLDIQFFAGYAPHIGIYDAKDVIVTVGNVEITGFIEGTFVKSKKKENAVNEHVSPQGDVAFAINNNSLGEIEITLNQTSPSIIYLNSLAAKNEMVPIWVTSNQNRGVVKEKSGGSYAMINKHPEAEYGDKITGRKYTFLVADYQITNP